MTEILALGPAHWHLPRRIILEGIKTGDSKINKDGQSPRGNVWASSPMVEGRRKGTGEKTLKVGELAGRKHTEALSLYIEFV